MLKMKLPRASTFSILIASALSVLLSSNCFTPVVLFPANAKAKAKFAPPKTQKRVMASFVVRSRRRQRVTAISLSSRFEGMQREPTEKEIQVMDDMITKMANAPAYELPNAVSRAIRVVSSPRFFLRIAERADAESDPMEKERLSALAENLVTTIQAVVSMTEESLDERAKDVEKIVKAASEPESGEFLVPLSPERIAAMREEVEALDERDLNEAFLSTIDSWMNKAHQDGMDGMVEIMQKALQIYAGTTISRARIQLQASVGAAVTGEDQAAAAVAANDKTDTAASVLLDKLLCVDTDAWETEVRKGIDHDVSKESLVSEVQKTMEGVILGLENGSMSQRVQAEFLKELVLRIEAV